MNTSPYQYPYWCWNSLVLCRSLTYWIVHLLSIPPITQGCSSSIQGSNNETSTWIILQTWLVSRVIARLPEVGASSARWSSFPVGGWVGQGVCSLEGGRTVRNYLVNLIFNTLGSWPHHLGRYPWIGKRVSLPRVYKWFDDHRVIHRWSRGSDNRLTPNRVVWTPCRVQTLARHRGLLLSLRVWEYPSPIKSWLVCLACDNKMQNKII